MSPPVSPLSTTTTRRTSCTLATRIPDAEGYLFHRHCAIRCVPVLCNPLPRLHDQKRLPRRAGLLGYVCRVLLPLVDRLAHIFLVLLRVRALPAHGDSTEVRDQGGVLHVHRRRRLRGRLLRLLVWLLRDGSDGTPRVLGSRDGYRALRLLLGDGGVIRQVQA